MDDLNKQLLSAVNNGDIERIKELLNAGANVNGRCYSTGWYFIHIVSARGQWEIVELLIEKGADSKVKNNDGNTPSHFAIKYCNPNNKTIEILLSSSNNDIDTKNNFGNTLLHSAVMYRRIKVISLLLSKYADYNITNNKNKTPLQLATESGVVDIINIFNEHMIQFQPKFAGRAPYGTPCGPAPPK